MTKEDKLDQIIELLTPISREEADRQELLRSARFWLDNGKWDKRGKRAYAHSVAESLLSIATSLDYLVKKEAKDERN